MLIALYIASQVSKAADSLRRIEEGDEWEHQNGINRVGRILDYKNNKKRIDKELIEEQLGEIPKTPREVHIPSEDDPYHESQMWI
jgi:hypothetical protein